MENNDYLCTENQSFSTPTMNIKEKIKQHGRTIADVGESLGLSRSNLTQQLDKMENNNAVTILRKVAKELGISVSELIDDDAVAPEHISLNIGGQSVIYTKEKEVGQ